VLRELGSERRETVWSLSVISVKELKMIRPSTQGLGNPFFLRNGLNFVNLVFAYGDLVVRPLASLSSYANCI